VVAGIWILSYSFGAALFPSFFFHLRAMIHKEEKSSLKERERMNECNT
jgi:hypothetical protein